MTSTATGDPGVEPKEPAISMGFVNMASDNFEMDESGGEGSSSYERSISDSEIDYYDLGECSGEQSSGRWYLRCLLKGKKKICGFPVSLPYLAFGRRNPDPKLFYWIMLVSVST